MKRFFCVGVSLTLLLTACGVPNMKNDEAADGENTAFTGIFNSDTATLDLYQDDSGIYVGEISIEEDDDTAYYFSFSGQVKNNRLSYSDGTLLKLTYDKDGDFLEESIYEGTNGTIKKEENNYIWKDDKVENTQRFVAGK